MNVSNVPAYYTPYAGFAACQTTIKSPVSMHGMAHPAWVSQFEDPNLDDAVRLNALKGLTCERQGAPTRDQQFVQLVVEHRPVTQFPTSVAEQSDNVPMVFDSQVGGSCGFDVGNDQLYVGADLTMYCSGAPLPSQ
jgi:hypothetical protein